MIRDVDHGAKALLRRIKARPKVNVGIMGSEASASKAVKFHDGSITFVADTVADIATIHEFGLGVPPRSFIGAWADESEPEARRRLRKAAERIAKRGGLPRELERFGLWAQGQIQLRITRGIDPPLAPETIQRKGSSKPLIDTGQTRSSVTFVVKNV